MNQVNHVSSYTTKGVCPICGKIYIISKKDIKLNGYKHTCDNCNYCHDTSKHGETLDNLTSEQIRIALMRMKKRHNDDYVKYQLRAKLDARKSKK